MLRKDMVQHAWIIYIPLLIWAAGAVLRIFGITYSHFSTNDILQALSYLIFLFVIPFLSFLAGMAHFRQEEWRLVRSLPHSRFRILAQKSITAFLLVLISAILTFGLYALLWPMSITIAEVVGFWLLVGLLFVLGVVAGIGTPKIPHGIFLVAVSLFLVLGIARVTGLLDRFLLSFLYFGPVIFFLLVLLSILLMKGVWYALFYGYREFRPIRNALLAGSGIVLVLTFVLGVNAWVLHSATTFQGPSDYFGDQRWKVEASRILYGEESMAVLYGFNKRFHWIDNLGEYLDFTTNRWSIAAAFDSRGEFLYSVNRYDEVWSATPSGDHSMWLFVLSQLTGNEKWNTVLKVTDRNGTVYERVLDVNEVEHFSYRSDVFWRQESRELCILLGKMLHRVNMETGEDRPVSLPTHEPPYHLPRSYDMDFCTFLDGETLVYVQRYGEDGYRIMQYVENTGKWKDRVVEGQVERAYNYRKFIWDPGWHVRRLNFSFNKGFVFLHVREGELQHFYLEAEKSFRAVASDTGVLVSRNGNMTLLDWENGSTIHKKEMPWGNTIVLRVHGDQALIQGYTPIENGDSKYSVDIFLFNIPSGAITKVMIENQKAKWAWCPPEWSHGKHSLITLRDKYGAQVTYLIDMEKEKIVKEWR